MKKNKFHRSMGKSMARHETPQNTSDWAPTKSSYSSSVEGWMERAARIAIYQWLNGHKQED